jgi:hypothetical protein
MNQSITGPVVQATPVFPRSALKLMATAAAMAWGVASIAGEPTWTIHDPQLVRVRDIRQFDAGKFVTRTPLNNGFLELVATLRNARSGGTFGPALIAEIALAAEDSSGLPWQAPLAAVGTKSQGNCQYLPKVLSQGRTVRLELQPAGELRMVQDKASDALQLTIQAEAVTICFAFDTPHDLPSKGVLIAAGERIPFGKGPPERDAVPPTNTWMPWIVGTLIFSLAGAGYLLMKRPSRRD